MLSTLISEAAGSFVFPNWQNYDNKALALKEKCSNAWQDIADFFFSVGDFFAALAEEWVNNPVCTTATGFLLIVAGFAVLSNMCKSLRV